MSADWNALCRSAKEYPLPTRLSLARSCFGALVGLLLLVAVIAAWLSARFYRISKSRRLNEDGRANVWPLYASSPSQCNRFLFSTYFRFNHLAR